MPLAGPQFNGEISTKASRKRGGSVDAKETPKKDAHAKKVTAQSLSDVTALFAKKFPCLQRPDHPMLDAWAMSSYKEGVSEKIIAEGRAAEWATHNTAHFSRVYPRGRRIESTNYNPCVYWDAGVQMASPPPTERRRGALPGRPCH